MVVEGRAESVEPAAAGRLMELGQREEAKTERCWSRISLYFRLDILRSLLRNDKAPCMTPTFCKFMSRRYRLCSMVAVLVRLALQGPQRPRKKYLPDLASVSQRMFKTDSVLT